jgi:hypothetical protein
MRPIKLLTLVFLLATTVATLFTGTSAKGIIAQDSFTATSRELDILFNNPNAKGAVSSDTSQLYDELVAFSNQYARLGELSEKGGDTPMLVLNGYPRMAKYFAQAAQAGQTEPQFVAQSIPAQTCGSWWWPKPSRAAPWGWSSTANPHQTLLNMGFHQTPGFAGGGYTRDKTYNSGVCGRNTYRDHGQANGRSLGLQIYSGTPGGEPNPEVWRTGPWPYLAWPAYVYWWHQYR